MRWPLHGRGSVSASNPRLLRTPAHRQRPDFHTPRGHPPHGGLTQASTDTKPGSAGAPPGATACPLTVDFRFCLPGYDWARIASEGSTATTSMPHQSVKATAPHPGAGTEVQLPHTRPAG